MDVINLTCFVRCGTGDSGDLSRMLRDGVQLGVLQIREQCDAARMSTPQARAGSSTQNREGGMREPL
jgi:hypothetical protein